MITGQTLRDAILSGANNIANQRTRVDELNVFPVPDGDTGTNMSMTIGAARAELEAMPDSCTVAEASKTAASAMLRGARGNSGVITSLLFRGFSKALEGKKEADVADIVAALKKGVEGAYKAVMKPTEGTILTVSRLAAEKAAECTELDVPAMWDATLQAGQAALDDTPNLLPVLKKAGVVDAGGMGFCMILDGMLAALQGNDIVADEAPQTNEQADFGIFDTEDITFAYDTVYIVRKNPDVSIDPLRIYLDSIGDSLVIGEDDEAFKVHVHTNIPWEALNESQKYGTLELAKIENMRMQHDDLAAGRTARSTDDLEQIEQELESGEAAQKKAEPSKRYGSVAVCAGKGLAGVFRDLGVDEVVEGGQTMNPSTEDILQAIERTPAEIVFVLPNNKNIIMAAEQAAPLSDKTVIVIPSKTVPQGITAMLNFDASMEPEDNVSAMTESLDTVLTMQITYAARNSDFDGHEIHEGDYLGLAGGALLGTSRDITELLTQMADKVAAEGQEFVNIFYGSDITEADAEAAADIFRKHAPDAEVNVLSGGQPIYYYLISAE